MSLFRSRKKPSRRRMASGPRCQRCRAGLPARATRCLQCGNRTQPGGAARLPAAAERSEPQLPLVTASREDRPKPASTAELTEIQKEILMAAQQGKVGKKSIHVLGTEGRADGEVKSGGQRFFGNDAVAAVVALLSPGLIEPVAEDAFELTETGLHSAVNLVMARQFGKAH